jgi:hypothetical protein
MTVMTARSPSSFPKLNPKANPRCNRIRGIIKYLAVPALTR